MTSMTSSNHLAIDIETYSDEDLIKTGVYRYAESDAFEILLIAYRFSDESETKIIDTACLPREIAVEMIEAEHPRFFEALVSPGVLKTAFNASFERTCLAQYFGHMPPEQWQCTMVRSAELGLPMSLAGVGEALGLSEDQQKMKVGKELIRYFSKPCKPTKVNNGRTRNLPHHDPDKWKLFKTYCIRDVDTEQTILEQLNHYGPVITSEQRLWEWDQRMNDYGILLDVPYIEGIIEYDAEATERLKREAVEITHLANPNSVQQMLGWLRGQGVYLDGLTKATVSEALAEGDLPDEVRRALEIRQALGKTSTKKFTAMTNAVCKDGRLRGILQFYGASRTGRWAGRIVQVHNLPQNHIDDLDTCRQLVADKQFEIAQMAYGEMAFIFSQLVRTAFIAKSDHTFVVSDFSAIEARVIAWLAEEQWRIDVFANGGDIYCASASQMFGVPVEKHGVNGHLRQRGKVAELALGYQGGVNAMIRMDTSHAIPEEDLPGIVEAWRKASPNIVRLWNTIEKAARVVILEGRPKQRAAKVGRNRCLQLYMADDIMFIELPSGRRLAYYGAELVNMDDGREHICYMGTNQETKKWGRNETYGGKLTENITQAIARDCLAEAIHRTTALGYRIVMHVHDEIIVEVPRVEEDALDRINRALGVSPSWAEGLILRGDGYVTPYYKKD